MAPTPLPFASIRDLDIQRQQYHDQTLAKHQSSPLGEEQRKRAKTLPQPDLYDAPDVRHGWEEQNEGRDRGRSRTRVDHQSELDRAHSKNRKRSKSRRRSKSRKCSKSRRSKSHKRDGDRERDKHEPRRPGVWSSQREREMPGQSPSRTTQKDMWDAGHAAFSNDLFKFRKLKDEVVKNAQSYFRRRATVIFRTLSPDHEAVKCLSATRHRNLQWRCSLSLNGAPNTGSSKRPSRCLSSPDGSECLSSHRTRPRSEESYHSCLQVATLRTSTCVVR